MQNHMKATAAQLMTLRKDLDSARISQGRTNAEIGRLAGVDPSQVSRICRGRFKRISYNVVQVCSVLGIKIETVALSPRSNDVSWRKLEASLRKLWDDTPQGAAKISRVLETIGNFKER
ncbi:MAG: helix-turn-helix transcriptional regulator [Pacificimonas sp.]